MGGSPRTTTTGWVPEPDGRGTFSLISSCVLTLTLCVWSALHLNVPPAHFTFCNRLIEKLKWIIYGIFAPELVVATAASQYITARWLKTQIEQDSAYRIKKSMSPTPQTWDIAQCFYAAMGGIAVSLPLMDSTRVAITPEGIRLLSLVGMLPDLLKCQIQDKSKADWMAKLIVCIQAAWLVAQVIGRLLTDLPVSLLEINTCGHVACAFALYLLWWSKPLDVESPTILPGNPELTDMLTLMYMCSEMSAVAGLSPIRCFEFIHDPNRRQNTLTNYLNEPSEPGHLTDGFVTVQMSIGSVASRDAIAFLGNFTEMQPGGRLESGKGASVRYRINPKIAPECQIYFEEQYQGMLLRHSRLYCRRAFQDTTPHEDHAPISATLLANGSKAAERLWQQCIERPLYKDYYFTLVPQYDLAYLGETASNYIVPHLLNFPSLTNLSLGQVNVSSDVLRSVFAATAAVYGGLHLSAWNEILPSRTEKILWITASLIIASSGLILWGYFTARLVAKIPSVMRIRTQNNRWILGAQNAVLYFVLTVFAVARVFLVIEAFISLRHTSKDLYKTPGWTDIFPHL